MVPLDLGRALRAAHGAEPSAVPDIVLQAAEGLGATDVVVLLVDFAQTTLEPVPDRNAHADAPHAEEVATSVAGRAFVEQGPVLAARTDGTRIWVPIVEGSDRTGVLALTVPEVTDEVIGACEELGLLAGHLIATHARATDLYNLYRRRRSLSLAASMQWDLLPPLVLKSQRLCVAALLEPAYEVGGDCFDYALNGSAFDIAVFDAVGHGVGSALISALAVGAYRHDRREGRSLERIHAGLDEVMASQLPPLAFATGQLARIDLDTGAMSWTNAGHPLPLLIRRGRVVGELLCPPTPPWGLGSLAGPSAAAMVATEQLEPSDQVLFYTDGVVEAHRPGQPPFGVERLIELAGQHASDELTPEEFVRRLVQSVMDHQANELGDDATLVLVRWEGPTSVPMASKDRDRPS
ncbi:MAG: PP2C family protein-serine/threonine phosphatase [Acidimicrobiales bacterium]